VDAVGAITPDGGADGGAALNATAATTAPGPAGAPLLPKAGGDPGRGPGPVIFVGDVDRRRMGYATATKLERVAVLSERRALDELWFLKPANYAWLTGGDPVVDATSDVGVAAVGVGTDGVRVVAPNNERARIVAEELPALESADIDVTVEEYGWETASLREAVHASVGGAVAADVALEDFERLDVTSLRAPMPRAERERYREACAETTAAVESVCPDLTQGTSEREAAAALAGALRRRGFAAPVVLVGGSTRARRHRHYAPTDASLGGFAHLSVVSNRGGQDVAVTRTLEFDPPPWLRERHDAACRVAATAAAATRAVGREGGPAGDVFDAVADAYEAVDYAGEWREHHQGGAIGYETREWTATPDSTTVVDLPMPFAWNPTVQGAKCEDTVLVAEDGIETLTAAPDWPTTTYDAVGFDVDVAFHDPFPVGAQ